MSAVSMSSGLDVREILFDRDSDAESWRKYRVIPWLSSVVKKFACRGPRVHNDSSRM